MDDRKELAALLRQLREEAGMSQYDAAYAFNSRDPRRSAKGVGPSEISRWERGVQSPRGDVLLRLLRVYGVALTSTLDPLPLNEEVRNMSDTVEQFALVLTRFLDEFGIDETEVADRVEDLRKQARARKSGHVAVDRRQS